MRSPLWFLFSVSAYFISILKMFWRHSPKWFLALVFLFLSCLIALAILWQDRTSQDIYSHWIRDIQALSPPKNLMVGSSSIMRMDAENVLKCGTWINRGIGSATIDDIKTYIRLTALRPQPPSILLYVAENDIAGGQPVTQVTSNFVTLSEVIKKKFPSAQLHVLAIKPSPARTRYWAQFNAVNDFFREYAKTHPKVKFYDPSWPKTSNTIDTRFFVDDGVHLTALGYRQFTKEFNEQECSK